MENSKLYSISEINNLLKEVIDNIPFFNNISLKGEISNCRGRNISGHLYFSLKDEKCSINAVMFSFDCNSLDFAPKNGDEVIVTGRISLYPPSGTYQIICKSISLYGKGNYLLNKEKLKNKLFKEGIFDESHKKDLPKFPNEIAIITGKNSAASRDFEFNILRRYPLVKIKIFSSLVQGENAYKDLIQNLNKAIESNPDLIIIGRGGGSIEDLDAFDNEELVREIYKCNIPVISAVGHEINLSLCDLVADKHASTPTGAAELAVPDIKTVIEDIGQTMSYIETSYTSYVSKLNEKFLTISGRKCFKDINAVFDVYSNKIEKEIVGISFTFNNLLQTLEHKIDLNSKKIELLNPLFILSKGYSILYDGNGNIIKTVKNITKDDKVLAYLNDGSFVARVEEVTNGTKEK